MDRLADKFALITGGSSGIGLETARQYLREGATVAITGRSQQRLEDARRLLGDDVLTLVSDAGKVDDQAVLAQSLTARWPRLDIFFANAADVTHRPIEDWDEASFDTMIAANLKGPFFLVRALLPLFADPSSIILCGSVSAHIGLAQSSVYAASKAGLLSLVRTLSGELKSRGIRVNGLSPGPTETPALGRLGLDGDAETALREEIRSLVPIGRMGRAEELAMAAVFMGSDEATYMIGTELLVDGGVANL